MQLPNVIFAKCDAEKVPSVANQYSISMVPCIIVTETRKQCLLRLENEVPGIAFDKIEETNRAFISQLSNEREKMYSKINGLLSEPGVLLFIKGTP